MRRFSGLESTARLVLNDDKPPVDVSGQRNYRLKYVLWCVIPLLIVLLVVLLFA